MGSDLMASGTKGGDQVKADDRGPPRDVSALAHNSPGSEPSCATVDKSPGLSEPQFPCVKIEIKSPAEMVALKADAATCRRASPVPDRERAAGGNTIRLSRLSHVL